MLLQLIKIKITPLSKNESNKAIILLIIIVIFIFSLILNNTKKIHLQNIYKEIEEFESSNQVSFFYTFFVENEISRIKNFWKLNVKNELIDYEKIKNYKKRENPEVSVIITVYNQVNCFYKALRSVQNQSLKNLEIFIVDDCSSDNSIEIIESYQKKDNRIILLKHLYNYGKIKSRSDAIKLAKGKYILCIDGDDGLANRDILYKSFTIAKIGNLDIVEFKKAYFINSFYKRIENNLDPIEGLNNKIIYQPKLKYKFIKITGNNKHFSYLNRNICSKLIRNEIFKQVLQFIGTKYIEDYMLIFEDTIMSVSSFILSNSYYLMKEPGYYRSKGECKESSISKNETRSCGYNNCIINTELDSIKYFNFLIEKLNNSKIEEKFIFHELSSVINIFDLYKNINKDFNYVYSVLDLLLYKFKYFTEEQKNKIINFKKSLMKKKKNFGKN